MERQGLCPSNRRCWKEEARLEFGLGILSEKQCKILKGFGQVSMNFSQSLQTALADDLFLLGQISPELSSLAPSCAGPSLRRWCCICLVVEETFPAGVCWLLHQSCF